MLAKMYFFTVTAEMLTICKVLSILQTKSRGQFPPHFLPTPKLKTDTVAEDTCTHIKPPQSSLLVLLLSYRKETRQITLLPLLFPY